MSVAELHPEELFDKLLDGELSAPERERLDSHLQGCSVCRFEYAARLDFQQEALTLTARPMPLGAPRALAIPARRRRSRALVWGLAAASLITAGGALASVLTGTMPLHALASLFSKPNPPPTPLATKKKAPATAAHVDPAPALSSAAVAEAPPVAAPPARPRRERALAAAAPVTSVEPASAAKLFAEANQARRAGDVTQASSLYHSLQSEFPTSKEAELSSVTLALLLLDQGDARGALAGFDRYLNGSSLGLEPEALVGRARALGRLGQRALEISAWQAVQHKYPGTIYGRQASERLLALGQP